MGKRKLGALEKIDADLLYREEFLRQYEQYEAQRDIFRTAPASSVTSSLVPFRDLIDFVAHIADCYPDLTTNFFGDLSDILTKHHAELEPELREKIVGCLALLRKKDLVDSQKLLLTFFPILTTTTSKSLRAVLFQRIVSELRTANAKTHNHKLNRSFQTLLFDLVTSDRDSPKGLWAVKLTRDLWRRRVWTDSKAVEIMKEASLSDNAKVAVGGVRFFLGVDQDLEESDSEEEDTVDVRKLKHQAGVTKKTKKRLRTFDKAMATVKKKQRAKGQPHPLNFSALHLLHDPQGFAEAIFSRHLQSSKSKLNLAQKLLVLQLVSRLVGLHKLTLISLYSYFLKYLTPRQPSVTSFLASLAQATHNLVPPDVLEPLVQKIANEFVSEAVASEVASAGLNAIREICMRQPLAMTDTLLQDLVQYRKSKDKAVMMAAKGLLGSYREVGPEMLRKRDRGKDAAMGVRSGERKERRFGDTGDGGIEGLDLLEKWKAEEEQRKRDEKGIDGVDEDEDEDEDEDDSAAWEVDSEDSGADSGGWINADSDVEIELSDSEDDDDEDEEPYPKKVKGENDAVEASNEKVTPEDTENGLVNTNPTANLATRKILTPADLAKLQELKTQASINKLMGTSKRRVQISDKPDPEAPITATDISTSMLPRNHKLRQQQEASGVDADDEDAQDKHKHRSRAAIRHANKLAAGKSTTNKEKARRKNVLMTLGKARAKGKRSLVETSRVLKVHAERGKRGGRRGNK
ncbi:MAG: Severe Depolymerization of Actin [Watsoniomyces obsoletus]|nr:MAG: Severe Depolymerization of Actin [Watsoniomyces obsoletus]